MIVSCANTSKRVALEGTKKPDLFVKLNWRLINLIASNLKIRDVINLVRCSSHCNDPSFKATALNCFSAFREQAKNNVKKFVLSMGQISLCWDTPVKELLSEMESRNPRIVTSFLLSLFEEKEDEVLSSDAIIAASKYMIRVFPSDIEAEPEDNSDVEVEPDYNNEMNNVLLETISSPNFEHIRDLMLRCKANLDVPIFHDGKLYTVATHAARFGRLEALQYFCKHGANLGGNGNDYGFTPLLAAAENGHSEVCSYLLTCKVNVDETNVSSDPCRRSTALMLASQKIGNHETVKVLLQAKADPNLDNTDESPLIIAARAKNHVAVEYLLSAKADINLQPKGSKETALMAAAMKYDHLTFKIVLSAKPDMTLKDIEGRAVSHAAVLGTMLEALNEAKKWQGNTAFKRDKLLAKVDIFASLKELHKQKVDFREQNHKGQNALQRVYDEYEEEENFVAAYAAISQFMRSNNLL